MEKMTKLACAVFAVVGMSGCASTQVAGLAGAEETQAVEQKVSRALPSYDGRGGYRMRRFAAAVAAS